MRVVIGDMWSEVGKADVVLVTTNSIVNKQGRLVMGRGAALEAATRYPLLPTELADRIKPWGTSPYGIIILKPYANGVRLGAFQVKRHWQQPADPLLISRSAALLRIIAKAHPDSQYVVNYPGIGNGRLDEQSVELILKSSNLPDNVTIYKKGKDAH